MPRKVLFSAVLLVVLALVAWRLFTYSGNAKTPAAPPSSDGLFHPTKEQWAGLKVAEAAVVTFRDQVITDGALAFNDDALTPVFSPYSGRVKRVIAKLGDVVKKGAPLFAVDAVEFVQGQSDLAAAKATLDTSRAAEKRQQELFEAGGAALKDWRQAQADLASAQSAYAAARGRLAILGKDTTALDAMEKGATGNTEALVTAPIFGTVTQRQVGVGQTIASASTGGSNPLFTLADLSSLWVLANVRESDAPALRVGQTAEVTLVALPERTFDGKVAWIGAGVDPITHRLPVRIELANHDGLLKSSMFARVRVTTGHAAQAPAVPEAAIVSEGEHSRLFVVTDSGIVVRDIQVGRRQQELVEIVAGLKAGEKVVTAGSLFVDRAAARN
jgi:cobalt-zinc-cadmium efflux system membrane fusion protein